jgi:hypothetical protein
MVCWNRTVAVKDAIHQEAVMKELTHKQKLELIASVQDNELYDKLITRLQDQGELTDADLQRIRRIRERVAENKRK